MSKGGRYNSVGESSLGYLFGSGEQPPPSEPNTATPPIGTDDHRNSINPPNMPSQNTHLSNNYPRSRGQNLGNFITGRPTTKVISPPGGDSSLGYLFCNKSSVPA